MKKILLVAFLTISTTTFSQEEVQAEVPKETLVAVQTDMQKETLAVVPKEINKSYYRFGMDIIKLGIGYGLNLSVFPLSFYVANDLQQIISFGFDLGFSESAGLQIGGHIGYGKMTQSPYNPQLYVGYLIEFSIGYSADPMLLPNMYLGFSPSFILEIDQFLFKTGIYFDSSIIVTVSVSLGFLH